MTKRPPAKTYISVCKKSTQSRKMKEVADAVVSQPNQQEEENLQHVHSEGNPSLAPQLVPMSD